MHNDGDRIKKVPWVLSRISVRLIVVIINYYFICRNFLHDIGGIDKQSKIAD